MTYSGLSVMLGFFEGRKLQQGSGCGVQSTGLNCETAVEGTVVMGIGAAGAVVGTVTGTGTGVGTPPPEGGQGGHGAGAGVGAGVGDGVVVGLGEGLGAGGFP